MSGRAIHHKLGMGMTWQENQGEGLDMQERQGATVGEGKRRKC